MKQHTSGPCVAHRQRAVTAGCAWLAALVCAVGAPPAQAAPAGPGLAGIGLDTLLDLEVTGASKLALRASESPSAVTVITADEIRALGHRTLADVLRSVAGVVVSSDRTYSYLGVRGFAMPGDYNTRILVLIDGNRVNDSIYGQGFLGSEFPLDLDLVERVEFIPGPGSPVHGANALLGVVNVITRRGGIAVDTEVAAALGHGRERHLRVTGNQPLSYDSNLLLSATAARTTGTDAYFPSFDTPQTNHGISHLTDHESDTQLFAKFVHGELSATFAHADRSRGLTAIPGAEFNDPRNLYRDTQTVADLVVKHRIDGLTSWKLRFYAGAYSYRGDFVFDMPPLTLNRDTGESRWAGVEADVFTERFADHKLVAGIDAQSAWRRDQGNADIWPVPATYLDDHHSSSSAALFAEDQWTVVQSLSLTAGARIDSMSGAGSRLSPRVGAVWRATPAWTLKFTHGTAFRPPNAYELYYHDAASYKGNTDLHDERVTGDEAIAEFRPDAASRVALSAYASRARDMLFQSVDPADGLLAFRNAGVLHAHGVGLEAEHAFANAAHLRGNLALQRVRDVSGLGLDAYSPRRLAKAAAIVPLVARWTLGSEAVVVGRRGSVPGYGIVNLNLSRPLFGRHALLSVGVQDVFDRRPSDPGSDSVLQPTTPQDGRSLRLKLELDF
jgi:outer membrane receptor protein involved in Fe transport